MKRLSLSTLAALPSGTDLRLPDYDAADLRVGIVHLGLGAFHRAHQAIYTEDGLSGENWGICAYTQRSDAAAAALAPQDGLYTLIERGPAPAPPRIVGSLREARSGPSDPVPVPERIADPAVRVVTLTVTEKGYRLAPTGRLDHQDLQTVRDAARFGLPDHRYVTVAGQLVAGLRLRRDRGSGPITVVSCDNLPANGQAVHTIVHDFCALLPGGDTLPQWIEDNVAFPSTVVDRIVPAATDADHADACRVTGLDDKATVVCEPHRQWVIEDRFAAPRPAWEKAGATLTGDVRPYEAVKLRMLNAAHSTIAYLGALAGHTTIAEAVQDPPIAHAAAHLMAVDAAPTLTPPPALDLTAYQDDVLRRFANPALGHTTAQVAADGSAKLPIRLLGTMVDRLDAGEEPSWAALAVAAWMVYMARRTDRHGRPLTVRDPLASEFARTEALLSRPPALVEAFLSHRGVFPERLHDDKTLRDLLIHHTRRLLS
ncbi:mannitol dehydrogenase family protein [Sphaerisporangium sp. NPDC051017]|uniref:mannitol dehydrogenase family protein n=1 Tax=Sphaerisporangium sp. NPDC051017 TaxID=3154636 RepID=UPI00341D23FB